MRKAIILAALMPLIAIGADSEFVLVKHGEIHPAGAVATLEDISQAAVQALVVAQSAATVSNAAAEVQAMVDSVGEVINSVEGVGYIRGYVLDFGVSEAEVNTNATANIIRYDHAVSNDVTIVYSDIYVYFSEEPAELPVLQWAGSPRVDATWQTLPSVATTLTTITVDAVQWECYRITVAMPLALSTAFFRVFATAQQQQVGAFLPVRNGIKVGAFEPLTAEVMCGTNTIKFVGGVRVQ